MYIHKEQKVASHIFDGAGVSAATRSPLRFGLAIAGIESGVLIIGPLCYPKKRSYSCITFHVLDRVTPYLQ